MSLRREIKAGQVLRHQRVVELLDVFEHEDDVHLVGTFFCSLRTCSVAWLLGRAVLFVSWWIWPSHPKLTTFGVTRSSLLGISVPLATLFCGQLLI